MIIVLYIFCSVCKKPLEHTLLKHDRGLQIKPCKDCLSSAYNQGLETTNTVEVDAAYNEGYADGQADCE